ncbi:MULTISPECIES: potassium-transporting ATPase subunit KdpA [Burkholderia]|uniref:potassium-transporting ATPase subunit KdpA n=1 Tax=Burkholderia TaxID=32008 RepID=UPI000328051F|nr:MULTISPECIES: potassium-transporting ATPase subunit KdpA [Burkholderia]AGK51239.1 K+-transporting ATPase, A subunit [Burkholderia thailandensis MSMB121]ATF33757.1 potassium-transporting ATPase subunit KdpA [Burkholderia thailandensis]KST71837.1 ATPase [Burkholderia humptydooensis]KVN03294.1 ATPase [Burkholderia sp. MSMB1552]KWZ49955.1 ATPase [Burkholderia sp. MSMB1588]
MDRHAYLQLALFVVVLTLLVKPLGQYIARIANGDPPWPMRMLRPVERWTYRAAGVDPEQAMSWKTYAIALLSFSVVGTIALYALQRVQHVLPLNPQALPAVSADSAFNTAVSFATNTSWQGYAGETTLSYLTQMGGIAVQSFLSAAAGIAVLLALIRALAARGAGSVGNLWADLTRATLYVLIPLSALFAAAFIAQGTIQNFSGYRTVQTIQSTVRRQAAPDASGAPLLDAAGRPAVRAIAGREQLLPMGPVASQEAIKLLSGDGGGFFNANSAHPFENPTPFSNFLQMLALLLLPAALCHTFGAMVGDTRQGWAIYAAMLAMFVALALVTMRAEQAGSATLASPGIDARASASMPGGNMEGKETRFGIVSSALYATIATASGDGAVDAMHDSLTPIGGLVPMALMQTGEVVFGGPGSGLFGMLMHAMLAAFVAGLMIGRAPEYLGKKIDPHDMKLVAIALLATPCIALVGTAASVLLPAGVAGIANPGAHGFSEILYAFTSAANNNGSAFAGLAANTRYYNAMLGAAMWFGRFATIVPVLALAGSLALKVRRAAGPGALPTHGPLFVVLLIGTVVLMTLLTYLPALALGPIVEQVTMAGAAR